MSIQSASQRGGPTVTDANSTVSLRCRQYELACRAIVRQVERWFGFRPGRSATLLTIAPGRRLSETICTLTSSGQ